MAQTVFVKLALRRMMRKNPAQRDAIRQILRDRDLLDAVVIEATAAAASELGAIGEGSFLDFFEFLITHADEIMLIITKLLLLFADESE